MRALPAWLGLGARLRRATRWDGGRRTFECYRLRAHSALTTTTAPPCHRPALLVRPPSTTSRCSFAAERDAWRRERAALESRAASADAQLLVRRRGGCC